MRKLTLLSLLVIGFISAVAAPQTQAQDSQQNDQEWATVDLKSTVRGSTFEGTCTILGTGEIVIEGTTTLKDGTQVEVSASAVITTGTGKQASWKLEGDVSTSDGGTGGVRVTAKSFTSMLEKFTTKVIAASK